jgi:IMP dehydrogenase
VTVDNLVTAAVGTTLQSRRILQKNKIEKLPVVDENYLLVGLITLEI